VALSVFDAENAGQYPVEVGANEIVGEEEEGETVGVPGTWVGVPK
jgi:hypothetical protein